MLQAIIRPIIIFMMFSLGAIIIHPLLWIGSFILLLDTRSRYLDYRFYKGQVPTIRSLHRLSKSWCTRGVAEAIWPYAKDHFRHLGYRWWHILPDGWPHVLFKWNWWKSIIAHRRG